MQWAMKENLIQNGSFVLVSRLALMQIEYIDLQSEFLTCLKKLSLR